MNPPQQQKKDQQPATAPTAPKLIKAKVRPGGKFTVGDRETGERKSYRGGDVVEVSEREYRASKHVLVTAEDEIAEASAKAAASKPEDHTSLYRAFRHRARAAAASRKAAEDERQRQEIARLLSHMPPDALQRRG